MGTIDPILETVEQQCDEPIPDRERDDYVAVLRSVRDRSDETTARALADFIVQQHLTTGRYPHVADVVTYTTSALGMPDESLSTKFDDRTGGE